MKQNKIRYRYSLEIVINLDNAEKNLSDKEIEEIHLEAINNASNKSDFWKIVNDELDKLFLEKFKTQKKQEKELDEWFSQL